MKTYVLQENVQDDSWDGSHENGPAYGWGDFVYFRKSAIKEGSFETEKEAISFFRKWMRKEKIFFRLGWKGSRLPTHYIKERK